MLLQENVDHMKVLLRLSETTITIQHLCQLECNSGNSSYGPLASESGFVFAIKLSLGLPHAPPYLDPSLIQYITRCTNSQCMPRTHLSDLWTERRHMCITVNRRGTCFWDGQPCATKCEKNGKAYVERVPGSERGSEHLTEQEDMVFLRDGYFCFTSRCSLVLINLTMNFMG